MRTVLKLVVGVLGLLVFAAPARAAAPGEQWAVLVGVRKHEVERYNLRYTVNDVKLMRRTLAERAGVHADRILEMTDESPDALKPTLANLRRAVPEFLRKTKAGDRVLVFFSGHGVQREGATYLVPSDFRLDRADQTGLAVGELRDALANCPAGVKFLVLDCCHAGAEKAVGDPPGAETVAKAIGVEQVRGCVVLASCGADEKSLEWDARTQGVYTYWLCRALEGGAASDTGEIRLGSVNRYLADRVPQTAKQAFDRVQSPVQYGRVEGDPPLLILRPERAETLCRRMAEHLDMEIRQHKLKKVGVLEFLQPLASAEGLGTATLPAFCAAEVRAGMERLAGGAYAVLSEEEMRRAGKDLRVESVGDPIAMQRLGERAGGLDAVVTGTIRRRGTRLYVQSDLVATANGGSLATPSGVLPLTDALVGGNGGSFNNLGGPAGAPDSDAVVVHAQAQSGQGHPLQQDRFPFRVEVWSVQTEREEDIRSTTPRKKKEFVARPVTGDPDGRRTELLVPARKGEFFEVRIWNNHPKRAAVRLHLDGLNSLGQKRELLDRGRAWVIEPTAPRGDPLIVDGWYLPRGNPAVGTTSAWDVRRFRFVDPVESVAARTHFGERVGLISAAFFEEGDRSVAVGEGERARAEQVSVMDFRFGRCLGVIHIRYVDAAELNR